MSSTRQHEAAREESAEDVRRSFQAMMAFFDAEAKEKALFRACEQGHSDAVREFFINDITPVYRTTRDENRWTALHIASWNGRLSVVRLLISFGAIIEAKDSRGRTPLALASLNGQLAVVHYLLDRKADTRTQNLSGYTPLHYASDHGHGEVVTALIAGNATVDCRDWSNGCTPLYYASERGHAHVVRILLERGANLNDRREYRDRVGHGFTALHIASEKGHLEVVDAILEHDAFVFVNACEYTHGLAPLHLAATNGHAPVVRRLVDGGASVDLRGKLGHTALHMAAEKGHLIVLEALIDENATVNIRGFDDRQTPLHFASAHGQTEAARLLLRRGADMNILNINGQTALDLAMMNQHVQVVEAFQEFRELVSNLFRLVVQFAGGLPDHPLE